MTIVPSSMDRRLLGGIASVRVAGNLSVADAGSPQPIVPATTMRSYSELQGLLKPIGPQARKLARRGAY